MDTESLSQPPGPARPVKDMRAFQSVAWGVLVLALAASVGAWYLSRVHPELGANPNVFSGLIAASGGVISLLLFALIRLLGKTRQHAMISPDLTVTLRKTNEMLQREIAERRRAEHTIKDSEALYHSLVESLPLQIMRKDIRGRITFANHAFCTTVGKPLGAVLGKIDFDLFPAELAEIHQQQDEQVLRERIAVHAVEERQEADGRKQFIQAITAPAHDGEGNAAGIEGIFWDVTDKRRTEKELENERDLLRAMMDHLPDTIYFKDGQCRFLRISREHMRRFGVETPEQVIGKTDFDFFSEEHARQAYNDEQELMHTGKPVTKEEKETWPDGHVTWVLSTKLPLRNEHGQIIGCFGLSRDITDRKHAEVALQQAKEAAEKASQAKSQFLANLSRELRTPLASVIGFTNALLKNKAASLGPTDINLLERVHANGQHLLRLSDEILDLSKIEARTVELKIQPVALDALVRDTLAQQEGLVRDRPVRLLADLPGAIAPLQTDPDKLKRILIDLIGNAVRFTEQGSITVHVATDPKDHSPVRMDVIDTGTGIPSERRSAVFEAFQQGDTVMIRKHGGAGLGLTISRELCQLLGYSIEFSSEAGKGSTFSVMLKPPG